MTTASPDTRVPVDFDMRSAHPLILLWIAERGVVGIGSDAHPELWRWVAAVAHDEIGRRAFGLGPVAPSVDVSRWTEGERQEIADALRECIAPECDTRPFFDALADAIGGDDGGR